MITVILNAYKRLKYLNRQIEAINNQSIKPTEIIVWQNGTPERQILKLNSNIKHIYSSYNFGVWSRFSVALNSKNEFICVFDDDTIPGKNWIKNCLQTMEEYEGLLGARGVRFASKKKYIVGEEFGWNNPSDETKQVDIVGHSWFFKREWLSYFWKELPNFNKFNLVGEDIHFSYILQKYLGLNTFVPPHLKNDKSMWGSDKDLSIEIGSGSGKFAISYDKTRLKEMDDCFLEYIDRGFELNFLEELKMKGIYLDKKNKIGNYIKKILKNDKES